MPVSLGSKQVAWRSAEIEDWMSGRPRINADLGLSKSAHEYASIYLDYFKIVPGLFDFNGCTYYSNQKDRGAISISLLSAAENSRWK